uniref:Ribonuclease H-like domain-containing protein n=1 Tax=Tanacetum cinerariifolium TaxID=118510 RepID=A0A6L2P348_TANCI|nr:ribonuclease H-like domain-containing protein [Tanacetum cinerariifolium]
MTYKQSIEMRISIDKAFHDMINLQIFFIISSIAVQTPNSGISNLLAVGTTFTASGNSLLAVGMPCVFYSQHEPEVIEFGDSYEAPANVATICTTSDGTGKKKGRTVTLTADDIQKRMNDVIVSQLQFIDVEIKQDDLNQKFLTSLAPEWLMHTIIWRNRSDLDTMILDDLYNHLKAYESDVQKKSEPNTHNMAFISSTKHRNGNEEVNTASANIGVATISQDTACA